MRHAPSLAVPRTSCRVRRDVLQQVGDKLGVVESRVKGDLERFKEFIESRGSETGAWRGEIQGGTVESGASNF